MSDKFVESDISKLRDIISNVASTERALNEYTRSSNVNGTKVCKNLKRLSEFISEAKATLNETASSHDNLVRLTD